MESSRQVVVECCKFPDWECTSNKWHKGFGGMLYDGIKLDNLKALNKDKQQIIKRNEKGLFKVKILSFSQYNRYKTCLKMLKFGMPMTYFELVARGGLDIQNLNTIILFSKKQFIKDDVEDFSPTADVSGSNHLFTTLMVDLTTRVFIR